MSTPHEELDEMLGQQDEVVEFEPEISEVEDTPDGGAIVRMGPQEEATLGDSGFFDNLLAKGNIPASYLEKLATDIVEAVDLDIQSREGRDKQYEEGIRRTGIGNDAPGGASFNGATKTVHPMITKAAVDFESRAIKELCPPGGPVKTFIPGDQTRDKLEKAERKARHMNWQLTKQIREFKSSLEQLLTQLPMGGVQYQHWIWNQRKKRAQSSFIPVDKMIIPFAADNFYTAERRTIIDDITELEFEQRLQDGIYFIGDRMTLTPASPNVPDPTLAEKATQKIEGKEPDGENRDGLRRTYATEVMLDMAEWDDQAKGEARPYRVYTDKDNRKIIGIVRNWDPEAVDPTEHMVWTVEWPFIPWRGSMPIGIAQMIAGLSVAATGALRALLDSAHVNNLPTVIKLKGVGQGGESLNLEPTQMQELEGPMGVDDIRKLIMHIPFKEPSLVLYQLLGFLVQEGQDVVRTTFEDLAEQKQDMPVGTTLALIEQGMAVMSAIHGRLFDAMQMTLEVLHRINRMYITDDQIRDESGELLARREDYQGPLDVVPVADPRIFSEVQRFAQMQVVAERAEKRPALYNQRKVELLILERLKFPNPEQLLVPAPEPKEMNAVNENVAATLGRPITAFPEQEHLAHIQMHVDYMMSPFFGALEPIAPRFLPAMVQHLVEHITLWYASRVYEHASSAAGTELSDLMKFKDPETRRELDRVLAIASMSTLDEARQVFAKLPPIISRAMQLVQQFQQEATQAAQDPLTQGRVAVEQLRGQTQQQLEQVRQQGKERDRQARTQEKMAELRLRTIDGQRQSREQSLDRQAEMQREHLRQHNENQRTAEDNLADVAMNTADNETALTIAAAEIESAERVDVSTGTGINPGP